MSTNKFLEGAESNLNALQLSIGQLYLGLQNIVVTNVFLEVDSLQNLGHKFWSLAQNVQLPQVIIIIIITCPENLCS